MRGHAYICIRARKIRGHAYICVRARQMRGHAYICVRARKMRGHAYICIDYAVFSTIVLGFLNCSQGQWWS
jgi:hypothetical protein